MPRFIRNVLRVQIGRFHPKPARKVCFSSDYKSAGAALHFYNLPQSNRQIPVKYQPVRESLYTAGPVNLHACPPLQALVF
jgi:hypothetical protein